MAVYNKEITPKLRWIIGFVGLIIIIAFVVSRCSNKSENTYEPIAENGKGFIGKADALFAELATNRTPEDKINSNLSLIEQLNMRYPALKFALPEDADINELVVGDIRLVGIEFDSIHNKDLRDFYLNSELPNLLKKQQSNLYAKYFDVNLVRKTNGVVELKDKGICMIPSLFKIKFNTKTWDGQIIGKSYGKIDENNSLFLVYGTSILPVDRINNTLSNNGSNHTYLINMSNNHLTHNGKTIDMYNYYKEFYNTGKRMNITTNGGVFEMKIVKDTIQKVDSIIFYIESDLQINCGTAKLIEGSVNAKNSRHGCVLPFNQNVLRCIIENKTTKAKIGEFVIRRDNPMNMLSYAINTNKGLDRQPVDTLYTDNFTRQLVAVFNKNTTDSFPQKIELSIDPYLSKTLETAMSEYLKMIITNEKECTYGKLNTDVGEAIEISISLINSATGEILAAPSYSTQKVNSAYQLERKNPNLIRRYIGSCFKPIMTLAAVQLYPELLNFETNNQNLQLVETIKGNNNTVIEIKKANFLGFPIKNPPVNKSASQYKLITMQQYLTESNDVYPNLLAMYAFSDPEQGDRPSRYQNVASRNFATLMNIKENNTYIDTTYRIHTRPFAIMLDGLYNIQSDEAKNNMQDMQTVPELYVWQYFFKNKNNTTKMDSISFPIVSPEYTNMNYWSWYANGETFRSAVMTWVLGQGNNYWSPLKLTEAWARMTTKYPVELSFIGRENVEYEELLTDIITNTHNIKRHDITVSADTVWNKFLRIFKNAQTGTLLGAPTERIKKLGNYVILGKTGTPNELPQTDNFSLMTKGDTIFYDIGLYSFSLMTTDQFDGILKNTNGTAKNSGITAVVRIVHTYKNKEERNFRGIQKKDGSYWGIESAHARNFISNQNNVLEKILFYTDKLFR
jgi:hypothetical protein